MVYVTAMPRESRCNIFGAKEQSSLEKSTQVVRLGANMWWEQLEGQNNSPK